MNFFKRLAILISCTLAVLVVPQMTLAQPSTVVNLPKMTPAAQIPHRVSTVSLKLGDDSLEVAALQKALTEAGWPTWVDGDYGPHTQRTVTLYQRANGLVVDGIAGPQTLGSLGLASIIASTPSPAVRGESTQVTPPPVITGSGTDVARQALYQAGATQWEADFGVQICIRESQCTLGAINQNSGTGDNSWGPWQINYYGNMYGARTELLGEPSTNTSSWERAAANFLKMGRTYGWCHWSPPNYCAG